MSEARPGARVQHDAQDVSRTEQMSERPSTSPKGPDPLIGRVINGRFRIVNLVARGGMGKVYRAEQLPLGRICALKVLNPTYDGDSDPEFHRRFFLEAATAAKLTHPNTVTVFDYGKADDDDLYFIAMEFIEGKTLHRVLRESGPMSEARVAHVARQVCRSLREAHQHGVVHRDLKPANILLVDHGDERDVVKVLDFGLVKDVSGRGMEDLTQQGLFMGSPKYMAPEQIVGSGVAQTTDIYSLGVMLYEMLSGKVPFDKGKSVVTLMAHVNEVPPPMETWNPGITVSPAMLSIVNKCLEKDPKKRFPSMNDLLLALKRVGEGEWMTDTNEALPAQSVSSPITFDPNAPGPSSSGPRPAVRADAATPSTGVQGIALALPHSVPPTHAAPESSQVGRSQPLPSLSTYEQPKKSYKLYGVLVALAGAGVLAVLVLSGGDKGANGATPREATPGPAVTGAPVAAVPTAATVDATRVVKIESDPSGASVSEGGKELCAGTPCELTFRGDAAKAEHKLVLAKSGHADETVKLGPSDASVRTKLTAAPAAPGPVTAPKPRAVPTGGGAAPKGTGKVEGYKESPY
jgi:serine/threonine protein kinase